VKHRLLKMLFDKKENYDFIGDFEELYFSIVSERGRFRAFIWYVTQIIRSLMVALIFSLQWSLIMFGNYFKIALRNLKRYKGYSFINISGLAIGMACCILILLWVQDELSFDIFHKNAGDLYLTAAHMRINNTDKDW